MYEADKKYIDKKKENELKTFSVPFDLGEIKENITITTNPPSNPSNFSKKK